MMLRRMYNDKVIQAVLIFSGISIILLIIPMLAYFFAYILTILILWFGTIIFGDDLNELVVSIIFISMLLTITLYVEYRYIGDILRKFFGRRLTKEGREKRDEKKATKEKKMEDLFDVMDKITEKREETPEFEN